MTESDWWTSSDPEAMLDFVAGLSPSAPHGVGERKLRLFAAACFHARYGRLLGPHSSWVSWESGERDENQLSPIAEARSWVSNPMHSIFRRAFADILRDIVGDPYDPYRATWAGGPIRTLALAAWEERDQNTGHLDPVRLAILADAIEEAGRESADTKCAQCHGYGWLTKVRFIRVSRVYPCDAPGCSGGRIPNLLLNHLRSPGPHVRGCWGLDAALGHLAINHKKD